MCWARYWQPKNILLSWRLIDQLLGRLSDSLKDCGRSWRAGSDVSTVELESILRQYPWRVDSLITSYDIWCYSLGWRCIGSSGDKILSSSKFSSMYSLRVYSWDLIGRAVLMKFRSLYGSGSRSIAGRARRSTAGSSSPFKSWTAAGRLVTSRTLGGCLASSGTDVAFSIRWAFDPLAYELFFYIVQVSWLLGLLYLSMPVGDGVNVYMQSLLSSLCCLPNILLGCLVGRIWKS